MPRLGSRVRIPSPAPNKSGAFHRSSLTNGLATGRTFLGSRVCGCVAVLVLGQLGRRRRPEGCLWRRSVFFLNVNDLAERRQRSGAGIKGLRRRSIKAGAARVAFRFGRSCLRRGPRCPSRSCGRDTPRTRQPSPPRHSDRFARGGGGWGVIEEAADFGTGLV